MRYSVSEFKKHTRKILNEALVEPITVYRYDDEFIITSAAMIPKNADKELDTSMVDTTTTQANYGSLTPGEEAPPFEPVKELIKKRSSSNYCKEHGMDKQFCINMKHKGA